jgi:hypothetical protein
VAKAEEPMAIKGDQAVVGTAFHFFLGVLDLHLIGSLIFYHSIANMDQFSHSRTIRTHLAFTIR